jgi:Binding-protein-dependent transport system inner membrane component
MDDRSAHRRHRVKLPHRQPPWRPAGLAEILRFVRWLVPVLMPLSAIPYYLIGLILLFIFALTLKLFPIAEAYTPGLTMEWSWEFVINVLYHAVLPAFSIILASIVFWMLGMRGMMVTNMGEDNMLLADAKGLKLTRIFFRYAMRNAMLPQFTGLALNFGQIVSGAVLVEVIFSYPGMGWILWNARCRGAGSKYAYGRSGNQDLMLGLALVTGSNTLRGMCQNVSMSLAMALAARFSAFSTPTKIRRSGAGMLSGVLWLVPPIAGLTLAPHQLSFRIPHDLELVR